MSFEEKFRCDLTTKMVGNLSANDIEKVLHYVDSLMERYEINVRELALEEYNTNQLPEIVKTFLSCKIVSGTSDKTIEMYKFVLEKFFYEMRKSPESVTTQDIRVFLYKYQQNSGISNHSLDKYRMVLSSFYGWAEDEGYIVNNPTKRVEKIKYEQKQRVALTYDELEMIRSACETIRDKAIIEFLYSTGCRVSELCGLKKSDIDWKNGTVILFGKGKKYRNSYLNERCKNVLKQYLDSREDGSEYVFVTAKGETKNISNDTVEKMMSKLKEKSGLEKPLSPHIFRHTTATIALKGGMPVDEIQALLGHSSISTTMIYAKTDDSKVHQSHSLVIV